MYFNVGALLGSLACSSAFGLCQGRKMPEIPPSSEAKPHLRMLPTERRRDMDLYSFKGPAVNATTIPDQDQDQDSKTQT